MIKVDWSKRLTAAEIEAAAAAEEATARRVRAREYLKSTDWYVTRLNDPSDGRPIPAEVNEARRKARDDAGEEAPHPDQALQGEGEKP
jgi:hypothetical protein